MKSAFAPGDRNAEYTDAQRELSARFHAAAPELEADLGAAANADEVLVVTFLDGGSEPTGAARINRIPRSALAGRGEPRFDVPAPVKPGEVNALWVLVGQDGLAANVCIRLGRMLLGSGGKS